MPRSATTARTLDDCSASHFQAGQRGRLRRRRRRTAAGGLGRSAIQLGGSRPHVRHRPFGPAAQFRGRRCAACAPRAGVRRSPPWRRRATGRCRRSPGRSGLRARSRRRERDARRCARAMQPGASANSSRACRRRPAPGIRRPSSDRGHRRHHARRRSMRILRIENGEASADRCPCVSTPQRHAAGALDEQFESDDDPGVSARRTFARPRDDRALRARDGIRGPCRRNSRRPAPGFSRGTGGNA